MASGSCAEVPPSNCENPPRRLDPTCSEPTRATPQQPLGPDWLPGFDLARPVEYKLAYFDCLHHVLGLAHRVQNRPLSLALVVRRNRAFLQSQAREMQDVSSV